MVADFGKICKEKSWAFFERGHVLPDQGPVQPGFRQTKVCVRGVLVVKHPIGPLEGLFCPLGINFVSPLEGGGNQGYLPVHHTEHTADTGGDAPVSVGLHHGSSHAQRRHIVDVPGQDGYVAVGGADNQLLRFAVKQQAVRGDDFQMEGGHACSPPRYLATTSSMEPAKRK